MADLGRDLQVPCTACFYPFHNGETPHPSPIGARLVTWLPGAIPRYFRTFVSIPRRFEAKVWDVLGGGGRLLHTLSNHQKTVTCLALDGTGTRLLTGGLDRHVKIYNLESFKVRKYKNTKTNQTKINASAAAGFSRHFPTVPPPPYTLHIS